MKRGVNTPDGSVILEVEDDLVWVSLVGFHVWETPVLNGCAGSGLFDVVHACISTILCRDPISGQYFSDQEYIFLCPYYRELVQSISASPTV